MTDECKKRTESKIGGTTLEIDGCGRGEDAVELGWENGGSGEAGWVGMCGVEKEGCDDNPHRLEDWIFHFESVVWGLWK